MLCVASKCQIETLSALEVGLIHTEILVHTDILPGVSSLPLLRYLGTAIGMKEVERDVLTT